MGGRGAWRIGGYVADELIGYGASSQVWRGHVGRTAEPVALKVLDLADGSAVRAAKSEAALLSALDHPHLVRVRELVPDGESIVLVLELAAGGSLAQLLERRGRLSPGEVVTAMSPIAAALAYAHDAGVVHSDVSPANVLFRGDGSSLLADLGVARLVGGFDAPRSTLAYVDPGVAAGAMPSEASDVFMVAATVLHALTGAPPWSGDTAEAILDHAVTGEIAGLDARLADLPAALVAVVRRGLDPSPVVRGSAAEFALDLRHAAPPVPVDLGVGPTRAERRQPGAALHTDAASARAQLRSRLTSTARRDDSADGVYAPMPVPAATPTAAHGPRRRVLQASAAVGRLFRQRPAATDTVPASAVPASAVPASAVPGWVHVPRHAAAAARAEPISTVSTSTTSTRRTSGPTPSRSPASMPFAQVALERPDFARPDSGQTGRGSVASSGDSALASNDPPLALTHIVRSRVRPVEPSKEHRWPLLRSNRYTRAVLAVAVVMVLAGATAAWLRWEPSWPLHRSLTANGPLSSPTPRSASASSGRLTSPSRTTTDGSGSPRPSTPPPYNSSPSASAPSTSAPSTSAPRTSAPSTSPSKAAPSSTSPSRAGPTSSTTAWPKTDAGWTAVLASLDLTRQRAFAVADPVPLSGVYSDVALLGQDRATLRRVVAPGCRLIGLHTVYRDVHASAWTAHQVVLHTQASLAPTRLFCPHRLPQAMAGHVAVAMTIVLERVRGQFLIASIEVPT